ncbi:hypothetical protein NDU88_000038 [Pleurodeles waltl]|uniref:Uncharacterized protein n=1 Tax=Pleurodeles waltl TaxID=8319 RepID=A0AAV7LV92_PLEWA|nr:hypothetical protein NDU88_000038 [Pleurodeles waltl]
MRCSRPVCPRYYKPYAVCEIMRRSLPCILWAPGYEKALGSSWLLLVRRSLDPLGSSGYEEELGSSGMLAMRNSLDP